MYYSTNQSAAPAIVYRRLHTPKSALRLFLVRFSLVFIVILTVFSLGAIVQANAGSAEKGPAASVSKPAAAATSGTTITVEQGDTLWGIAQAYAPKGTNTRAYVEQLKRLNHLSTASLRIGQKLLLP